MDKLNVDSNVRVEIYADGSYNKDKNIGGYGIVVLYDGKEVHSDSGELKPEDILGNGGIGPKIAAAKKAINYCSIHDIKDVNLYYDADCVREFAVGNWEAKNLLTKHYKDFYNGAKNNGMNITFTKASNDNEFKAKAKKLAKQNSKVKR